MQKYKSALTINIYISCIPWELKNLTLLGSCFTVWATGKPNNEGKPKCINLDKPVNLTIIMAHP